MTTTVQILPTLEALPGRGEPTFGLTLAVALAGDRPDWSAGGAKRDLLRALLRPWSWDGRPNGQVTVKLVGVQFFAKANGHFDTVGGELRPEPPELDDRQDMKARWNSFNWDPFRNRLDNRLEAFRRQETAVGHPWGRGERDRPVDSRMRPWPTFLAEVSLLPRPIPQRLGLALRLINPDMPAGSMVAAAPVLEVIADGQAYELQPVPTGSTEDPCFEAVRFQYRAVCGLAIVAETALCAADGVVTDDCATFLDLQRLWVRPKVGALSGTDWRSGMEERLAQSVDEARLTIDAIRELTVPSGEETQRIAAGGVRQAGCGEAVAQAALVALDALRRLSCPGEPLRDEPNSCQPPESFLLRALLWLERELPNPAALGADRGAALALRAGGWLNDNVASRDGGEEARRLWASCLSQVLRPPAGGAAAVARIEDPKALPVLSALDDPREPVQVVALLPADQVVAELDQIYAAVTRPATARTLVEVLWQLVMASTTAWAEGFSGASALEKLVASIPLQVNMARELARDGAARNRPWMLEELRVPDRGRATNKLFGEAAGAAKTKLAVASEQRAVGDETFLPPLELQAVARERRAVEQGTWSPLELQAVARKQRSVGQENFSPLEQAGSEAEWKAEMVPQNARGLRDLRANFLQAAVQRVLFPEMETTQEPVAGGISLQVDTVDEDPEQRSLEDRRCLDLLRHLQGIAMFVRFQELADQQNWSGWFCVNHAAADLGEGPPQEVLVPARLGYQGGLRAPVLTYDGEPLTVGGPLAHHAVAGASLAPDEPGAAMGAGELDTPLIELFYDRQATMPGLAYGRKFQTAACIVTNSGGLPVELKDLRPGEQNLSIPDEWRSRVFHYRRCTPVGALGDDLGSRNEQKEDKRAPKCPVAPQKRLAPEDFAPRCHEIDLDVLLDDDDPVIRQRQAATEAPPTFPLRVALLVSPEVATTAQSDDFKTLEFQLTLPTVPLKVWERWIGYAPEEKPRLKFVRRSYEQRRQAHERACTIGCADACIPLGELGIYLTDPAVEGIVFRLVEVVERDGVVEAVPVGEVFRRLEPRQDPPSDYAAADPADPNSLGHEQRQPVRVEARALRNGGVGVWVNGEPSLNSDGRGEGLYRLSAYSVLVPGASTRFGVPSTEDFSFERPDEVVSTDASGRCLTSPWHLMIEVAEELPQGEDVQDALWQALSVSNEAAQGIVDVRLDLLQPGNSALAGRLRQLRRHVFKADLHQQSWEWQGRPPARHPDLPPAEQCSPSEHAAKLLAFEMSEHGTRGDEDARSRPMARLSEIAIQGMDGKKGRDDTRLGTWPDLSFGFREDLNTLQPAPDGRALHHRFGVRVFSRYASVLPPNTAFVDSRCGSNGLKWHPVWVPARKLVELTRPDVRMVLPLTSGDPEGVAPSGGLLVVCGPDWYEQGGLAEELEIEVVDILAPDVVEADCSGDPSPEQLARCERYLQVGTDPLVHRGGAAEMLGLPTTGRWRALSTRDFTVRFDGIIGGIGHHRGKPPYSSRFDLTSFLVPPPVIQSLVNGDKVEKDLSWWFFKVQFRRSCRLSANRDGVKMARSEPAAPHWVQLLPVVQRVEKEWFEAEGSGEQPVLRGTRLLPGPTDATSAARERFELVALMTERVHDIAGRRGQEAFLGLWWRSENAWVTDQATIDRARQVVDGGHEGLVVRWLEVQSRRIPLELGEGGELWRRLFDLDVLDKDRARIVRMSRPHVVAVEGN